MATVSELENIRSNILVPLCKFNRLKVVAYFADAVFIHARFVIMAIEIAYGYTTRLVVGTKFGGG
jgi:hypothetical protein